MDKLNSTEVMLAELIEQNNKQQKDVASMKTSLDTLSGELTKLNNILSPTLKPVKFEEVIPRKDADERAKYLVRLYGDMQAKYANLKAEYGELQAKTRYWASNQWAKHLFRWLFIKRHLWVALVYMFFVLLMSLLIWRYENMKQELGQLETTALKYRYVRASGVTPLVTSYVDSLFEDGDSYDFSRIHEIVDNYEKRAKQKCDSIMRSEQRKQKRY